MLLRSGRRDPGDELDNAPARAMVRIQIRVINRQAPAGAAAGVQSRHPELGELLPGQAAGQHDLASSAARCEFAARQDVEVDMQPPARPMRRDVLNSEAGAASGVRGHLIGRT